MACSLARINQLYFYHYKLIRHVLAYSVFTIIMEQALSIIKIVKIYYQVDNNFYKVLS
jgi:hypothetical protein